MSFFWFLLMLISFFMSCDNVMMMCISFLFIELSSNQVCFLHQPSLISLRNISSLLNPLSNCVAPLLYLSTAPCPHPQKYLHRNLFLAMNFKSPQASTTHIKRHLPLYITQAVFLNPFAQPLCIVLTLVTAAIVPFVDPLPLFRERWKGRFAFG